MRYTPTPTSDLLVARFGHLTPLSDHERGVLRLIEGRPRQTHRPDTRVLTQGKEIRSPHLILLGWASRARMLADGRKQIISLLLPGDAIGLCSRAHALSLTDVVTISKLSMGEAPEIAVAWREKDRVPGLAAALDLACAEEEFFMLAQVMRLGRQTAYERIAHWFMELEYRLAHRGLSTNGAFPLPLTQETLGDAVGLSVVHVNRTLQLMRKEGRIELSHGRLTILDKEAMRQAGEFVPPALSVAPELRRVN